MNRPDVPSNRQAYARAGAFAPYETASEGAQNAGPPSGSPTKRFACRVFNSIDEVDLEAWQSVCRDSGASVFLDPRFIAAVETSMKQNCRFWYVIVDDDEGRPAACACLTATTINLLDFTDPRVAFVIRHGPKFLSRFKQLKVLFCSLPGSPGEKSIAFTSKAASAQILAALDAVMDRLAAEHGAEVVIYKEFSPDDLDAMKPALSHGYRCIEIPPMHCLEPSFADFAHYCAALRANYRMQITRSTKKLRNSGIGPVVFVDPQDILRVYTPDIHAMYREMVAKSDLKVEVLPIEYYRQLTLRLAGQIELVALARDSKIIGFGWCLRDASTYHMMYAGINYDLNREFDIYFNLMFAGFDRALRARVAKINVGQTATVFKARMGCYSEPRYVFIKGVGPLMSRLFYYGANFLVIKKPSNPPSDIFKRGDGGTPK
jgi:predicted N-acyltransferase